MFCVGCPAEDGQPGLEGVLHEAEHQVYPARPRGIGRRSSSNPGTYLQANSPFHESVFWSAGLLVSDYCRLVKKLILQVDKARIRSA
jgi:hypothetical protein